MTQFLLEFGHAVTNLHLLLGPHSTEAECQVGGHGSQEAQPVEAQLTRGRHRHTELRRKNGRAYRQRY